MKRWAVLLVALAMLGCVSAVSQEAEPPPLRTLASHTRGVLSSTFSPDGKTLASGSLDTLIKLWDVATGNLRRTLTGHTHGVWSVAFSLDGATLASGSSDATIRLWDAATGSLRRTLAGHTNGVYSVAFSPDGKTLASGSLDMTIRLWDVDTGMLRRTLTGHADWVRSVTFSPDGRTLASGSLDTTIRLWDAATGSLRRTLAGHTDGVNAVAFSPDGKILASGSLDMTIRLWDAATGSLRRTLAGHTEPVLCVTFSQHDGASLASGSGDDTIKLWDVSAILYPNAPPIASFTWQALSSSGARLLVEPRTGDRIHFDASGCSDPDGTIVSYEWDWESDGTHDVKSDTATAEHTFAASGPHKVTLRVTDDKGATATVTQTINIGTKQPPQAGFSVAPAKPSILDAVKFTDTSMDADGQVTAWAWEFGDGRTSTERSPTHTYSRKGTFTVRLTVTDNDGLTGTKSASITVVNLPPTAAFTFAPQTPVLGQTVRFDASASTDRDGAITSYAWDFNADGKADATGATATFTFTSAGDAVVTLVVSDNDGATTQEKQTITVSALPPGPPRFARQWGVVIGVAQYDDPAIPDLQYTEADAQAFCDFLTDPRGGGFTKDNVRLLLNEEATTSAVKGAFSWLIQQAGKDDLVVIYFAGHGGKAPDLDQPPDEDDGVDEYLVTYDAKLSDLFSTAVRDDEVGNWLSAFRSNHVVVILDSCYAEGGTRSLAQAGTRAGPGNQVFTDLVGEGRLFLAASQETEVSYEDTALGHGVFTYYLLRGLGALEGSKTLEADADKDGRVTVEELETYLAREVSKERNQHPLVTGDLTLTRVALSGYGAPLIGEVTAIDGDRVVISLGSRQGVQVGDRFEVVHELVLPDGTTMTEVRAIIEVLYVLGPDRAACRVIESHFPIGIEDGVRQ